jgi:hypothetical protein
MQMASGKVDWFHFAIGFWSTVGAADSQLRFAIVPQLPAICL